MDVLVTLSNRAEVLVRNAEVHAGIMQGEVKGSGRVRFPVHEITRQRLADGHGQPITRRARERR